MGYLCGVPMTREQRLEKLLQRIRENVWGESEIAQAIDAALANQPKQYVAAKTPGEVERQLDAITNSAEGGQNAAQLDVSVPAGWNPIETAPKGKKVIAGYWNKHGKWRSVMARYYLPETLDSDHTESGFSDEGWYEESETYEEIMPTDCEPTHWQPLPAAPDIQGDAG